MKKLFAALVIVLALVAALAGSVTLLATTSTPAEAKACGICPLYCIPITCDGGRVFCNQCLADCAHAKHCTPGL